MIFVFFSTLQTTLRWFHLNFWPSSSKKKHKKQCCLDDFRFFLDFADIKLLNRLGLETKIFIFTVKLLAFEIFVENNEDKTKNNKLSPSSIRNILAI